MFVVGKGKHRVMIDAGDIRSATNLLVALRDFLNDHDVIIDKIFITHSHLDHYSASPLIAGFLFFERGQKFMPQIYRRMIDTDSH